MRVAIVGCGLIGNKREGRWAAPSSLPRRTRIQTAQQLALQHPGCAAAADWREVMARADVDLVVVATTNDQLAAVTLAAIRARKHVLVEKPAARNAGELEPVAAAARQAFDTSGVVVKVGFNHRFHPALLKAQEIVAGGALGPLMFIRGRYGHGGRLGMEKEWRGNPALSGGGEMLDQGIHLIDLARSFLGDFAEVSGHIARYFWDWPVEDNGFALLKTAAGQVAWLHASCTEWKNLFSLEIYGQGGKLAIDGLGGSYGVERLAWYRMLPQMGSPETTIWEYPGEDKSWQAEWSHFMDCIRERRQPTGNLEDAVAALRVVGKVYAVSVDAIL